jgi:isoquinoline 1-oxidoreductase beta subunit
VERQPARGLSSEGIFADFAKALDSESGLAYFESGSQDVADGRAQDRAGRIPRALPGACHDGADQLHRPGQGRQAETVVASTQVPSVAVDVAAKVAGVDRADVAIDVMLLGGGFGRRLETDMVAQAVADGHAHANGQPVQLIWTREDDTSTTSTARRRWRASRRSWTPRGTLLAWDNKSVSGAIGHQYFPRNLGLPGIGPDKTTAEGEYDMQYAIANRRIAHVIADSVVPIGYWRSVGHSHNAFFKEGFLDEVAHAAGKDPVRCGANCCATIRATWRCWTRRWRGRAPARRARARRGGAPVLRQHRRAGGRGVGRGQGNPRAPRGVRGRLRHRRESEHRRAAGRVGGGVRPVGGAGGEITLKDGRVQQSNFGDYPVLRMARRRWSRR